MPKLNDFFSKDSVMAVSIPQGKNMHLRYISYKKLEESKFQYRYISEEEVAKLANLIELDGEVLQPLVVRKNGGDTYEIIAGHKRHLSCKLLVEQGKEKFAMIPCYVAELNDTLAEFAIYTTNGYSNKSQYEIMREIEGIKKLLTEHPEAFPAEAKGRMVERIAKELGISRATVSEYQNISHNLGKKGMEAFKKGRLNKSAANTLAALSEEKQEKLIEAGITKSSEIKKVMKKEIADNSEKTNPVAADERNVISQFAKIRKKHEKKESSESEKEQAKSITGQVLEKENNFVLKELKAFSNCPKCKQLIFYPSNQNFCGNCGEAVRWENL